MKTYERSPACTILVPIVTTSSETILLFMICHNNITVIVQSWAEETIIEIKFEKIENICLANAAKLLTWSLGLVDC